MIARTITPSLSRQKGILIFAYSLWMAEVFYILFIIYIASPGGLRNFVPDTMASLGFELMATMFIISPGLLLASVDYTSKKMILFALIYTDSFLGFAFVASTSEVAANGLIFGIIAYIMHVMMFIALIIMYVSRGARKVFADRRS